MAKTFARLRDLSDIEKQKYRSVFEHMVFAFNDQKLKGSEFWQYLMEMQATQDKFRIPKLWIYLPKFNENRRAQLEGWYEKQGEIEIYHLTMDDDYSSVFFYLAIACLALQYNNITGVAYDVQIRRRHYLVMEIHRPGISKQQSRKYREEQVENGYKITELNLFRKIAYSWGGINIKSLRDDILKGMQVGHSPQER